jgi:hypothetical protein
VTDRDRPSDAAPDEGANRSVAFSPKAPSAFPGKATHQQTRAYNAALVLRALYDHSPISRA